MVKDGLGNPERYARYAPHRLRTLCLGIVVVAGLLLSLIGCGTTPGSVPASILTPTLEATPDSTSSPVPPSTFSPIPPSTFSPGVTTTVYPSPGTMTSIPTTPTTAPATPTLPSSPMATPIGGMHEVTLTIDNVTVTLRTPFLPRENFTVAPPGLAVQGAMSEGRNPYSEFAIIAVPFGTKPPTEAMPVARAGGVQEYLHAKRTAATAAGLEFNPNGPTAILFGQKVVSMVSLVEKELVYVDGEKRPTLFVEWVVEAGPRLWIIRITQEQPEGVTSIQMLTPFLQSLSDLTLSSTTLDQPSTLTTKSGAPPASTEAKSGQASYPTSMNDPDTLFTAPWWNGDCNANNFPGSYRLGGVYMNMPACGPIGTEWPVDFGYDPLPQPTNWGALQWQCVELVLRYMRMRFNINPYQANGWQVVNHYAQYRASYNPNGPDLEVVGNGGSPPAPQEGDILSYGNGGQWGERPGHTSLVKRANVNSSGNGNITVIEQNISDGGGQSDGISVLQVQNWFVNTNLADGVTGWLVGDQHYQPAAVLEAGNRLEVFARGRDTALWHKWQRCPNGANGCGWSGWVSLDGIMKGNPAVVRHENNVLEVFVRGSDDQIYKRYQLCAPNCAWSGWQRLGTGGIRFQGSPVAIINPMDGAYVFGWGADNQIWYSRRDPVSNSWSDWIHIASIATSNPSVALDNRDPNNTRVTVFHRGRDQVPYYSQQGCPSCGFGPWTSLGGQLDSVPAVGTTTDGRIVAFGLGVDASGVVYRNSQQSNGTWGGWVSLGGTASRGPVVGKNRDGALEVYVIQGGSSTYQNKLYRKTQLDNWYQWVQLGMVDWHVGLPGVGRNQDGRLELFLRHDNRPMFNMWQNSANDLYWTCCGDLSGDWP